MSKTKEFYLDLQELDSLENTLKHQLKAAELTLAALFHKRESLIRHINKDIWDNQQYLLDDLEQDLADIGENLQEIAPVNSILDNLIAT